MDTSSNGSDEMKFSTPDKDSESCAQRYKSGWWFNACFHGNLNGQYRKTDDFPAWKGIIWDTWLGGSKSLRKVVMEIKPRY